MKKTISLILVLSMILSMFTLSISAEALDLSAGSGAGWTWTEDTKTLELNGATLASSVVLPDGAKVVITGNNTIAAGTANAIESEGSITISGTGSLKLSGANGIAAASVKISGIAVDFAATSCGIQIYNETAAATAELTNVTGKIVGGYAGIYVNGECTDSEAKVSISDSTLDVTSTATSYNSRARKSGITVYVSRAKRVNSSIIINNSKVNATGYDAGLSINNYLNDADATNSACSRIDITNSTVVANGTSGVWAGIFASVIGQHPDADTTISITNSSVYAVSPNTGILTSSQKGESKIILDNSILGAEGKTALSMIEETSQKQVAELKNGSTYIQMTPAAVMKGEISVFDGKTIVADSGTGIAYNADSLSYTIAKGSTVTETFTDGTENVYTFKGQSGGIGGDPYQKEEIWGYDVGNVIDWVNDEPIVITTPEELIEFATIAQDKHEEYNTANKFDVTFAGRTVVLGANIDMRDHYWYHRNAEGEIVTDHRIPKFSGTFSGTYMGKTYSIKNMKYLDEYKAATDAMPLAFILNANGTFTNLTIDGITVDTVAPARFGGLADALAYSGDGYTENVHVKNITVNADAQLAFGGFSFKVLDVAYVKDCTVENFTVNANGVLNGPNSGRCGGFTATGGEVTPFIKCGVKNFVLNAKSTGTYVGGFIGGASMSASYTDCYVDGFELNAEAKLSAVGGFAGYTAGSAWGAGLKFENCSVKGLDVTTSDKIGVGAGGFIGNLYGQGKSIENGAHHFINCTTEGTISGNAYAGGFAGWLYGRSGGCVANFENCSTAVNILNNSYAGGGFVGNFVPYGSNLMITKYTNCTASGDVFAKEPVGSFLDTAATIDGIIGGTYNYDPENIDTATGETNNVAEGYRALDNGDGTWTVFPSLGKEVVKVAFHRFDENGNYENWRTVEVFKGVDFLEAAYNNKLNYSHPDYRFANGIGELDAEADDKAPDHFSFAFWATEPYGNTLALDNEIDVVADMNVYAQYTEREYKVTYVFDGMVPANAKAPAEQQYKAGATVTVAAPVADIEGYKFVGWNVSGTFEMPAKDVVITGTWKKIAASSIEGKVNFNGDLYAGQFRFELLDGNGKVLATTANDAKGNFSFDVKHTDAGIYDYVVRQIIGTDPDITYDDDEEGVSVAVDSEGGIAVVPGKVTFTNKTVKAAKKTISGKVYLNGELSEIPFSFVLTDKRGNVIDTATSVDGEFSFGTMTFNGNANNTYYVRQILVNDDSIEQDETVIEINVVVKRNKNNYSVSLSIIGAQSISFYNHQHIEEVVPGYAPTCTETGLTDGAKCALCGETLAEQEEIPALGHTEEAVAGKAPTCTETGLTDGVKCSVCGETLVAQEEIAALGHTEEAVAGKAPTCTETGLTDGVKCSVCGEILVAQEEIAALGHVAGEPVIENEVAPTTETNGSYDIVVYCTVCNAELSRETVVIPAETTIPEETTEVPEETTAPEETTEVPEVTTEPEEEITEEPTPLDPTPETTEAPEETTVAPEETTAAPEETTEPEEEITDPEIPLDPNPDTGDSSIVIAIIAVASIALAALYIKRREVIED